MSNNARYEKRNMQYSLRQFITTGSRRFCAILFMCAVAVSISPIWTGIAENSAAQSVEEALNEIGLPTIYIHTMTGESPTFDKAIKPKGQLGASITNNEYVKGYCQITNLDSDRSFDSEMKLKIRGNSSARGKGPNGKLPYKLVLKNAADLLGNGRRERRYILLAGAGRTLKTYLGFLIGKYCGMEWVPECRFVNVVLNDDYRGIYLLVSATDGVLQSDHVGPNGFMIECDAYWWKENKYFKTKEIYSKMAYTIKYPEKESLNDTRLREIEKYIKALEKDIIKNGSSDWIDEDTFIAWIMARDITGEADAAGANIYYYMEEFDAKDPARFKLHMGPLWDFDNSFSDKRDGKWSYQREFNSTYFRFLFQNEEFAAKYADRWHQLSPSLYAELETNLQKLVDAEGESIDASRKLDAERWGKTFVPLEEEIEEKLAWLRNRMAWIDSELKAEESGQ